MDCHSKKSNSTTSERRKLSEMRSKTDAKMAENPETEVGEQAPFCELCSFTKAQKQKPRRAHKEKDEEEGEEDDEEEEEDEEDEHTRNDTTPHFNLLLSTSFSPQLSLFHWECTQIYTNIYTFLREERTAFSHANTVGTGASTSTGEMILPSTTSSKLFSEEIVDTLSSLLLKMFPMFFEFIGYKQGGASEEIEEPEESDSQSIASNESFVSVLSMILPTFRMYLEWALQTKNHWITLSFSHQTKQIQSNQVNQKSLWSMLALHEALLRTTKELEKISLLIESNEENQANEDTGGLGLTGGGGGQSSNKKIPQVKIISNLFEEMLGEYKIVLGSLTEAILDALEHIANLLCRPIMMKEPSKSRLGNSLEYMELLISQILQPIADRLLSSPTSSRVYLFPKILDKCIDITIEEFAFSASKLTEPSVRQFEKSIRLLKTWAQNIEQQYNDQYCYEKDPNNKLLSYNGSKDSLQSDSNANQNNRTLSSFSSSTKSALRSVDHDTQAEAELAQQQQQAITLSPTSNVANGIVTWMDQQNQTITNTALLEVEPLTIPMSPSKDPSTADSDLGNNNSSSNTATTNLISSSPTINDTSSNTSSVMLKSPLSHPRHPHGSRRKLRLFHQVNGFKRLDVIFYAWIKKVARGDTQLLPDRLLNKGKTIRNIMTGNFSKSIALSINTFRKTSSKSPITITNTTTTPTTT